jgi:chitinase
MRKLWVALCACALGACSSSSTSAKNDAPATNREARTVDAAAVDSSTALPEGGTISREASVTDGPVTVVDSGPTPDFGPRPDGGSATGQWVLGYYAGYDTGSLPIAQIDWNGLTHIAFAPLKVMPGSVNLDFSFDEGSQGPIDARAISTAAHAHGVKALFMLGGQGAGSEITSAVSTNLAGLVNNLVSALGTYGYDGIDLDWEDGCVTPDGLISLAQALRTKDPSIILTFPGGMINPNFMTVDPKYVTLAQYLDQFNVQSYYPSTLLIGCGWDSGHNSPLSGATGSMPIAIDETLAAYATAGIPKSKLGMGMSFYAICYTPPVSSSCAVGSGCIDGPGEVTSSSTTSIVGGDNYYPLSLFFSQGSVFDTSTTIERKRDPSAMVPYLSLTSAVADPGCKDMGGGPYPTKYISYDDETSIIAKGTFSKANGYGGIIVWTINQGLLPANASGGRAPNALMEALHTGFLQ